MSAIEGRANKSMRGVDVRSCAKSGRSDFSIRMDIVCSARHLVENLPIQSGGVRARVSGSRQASNYRESIWRAVNPLCQSPW
jgi:hypothetical protein